MSCCWDSQTVGMRSLLRQICGVQNLWCKVTKQIVTCSCFNAWAWRHCLLDSKWKELLRTHEITELCTIHQWHKCPQHIVQQQALSRKQPVMYKYWKSCIFCLRLLQVYIQVNSIIAAATINMSVKLECSTGMPVDIKESLKKKKKKKKSNSLYSRHCMSVPSFLIEVTDWAKSGEILYQQLFSLHVHEQT